MQQYTLKEELENERQQSFICPKCEQRKEPDEEYCDECQWMEAAMLLFDSIHIHSLNTENVILMNMLCDGKSYKMSADVACVLLDIAEFLDGIHSDNTLLISQCKKLHDSWNY